VLGRYAAAKRIEFRLSKYHRHNGLAAISPCGVVFRRAYKLPKTLPTSNLSSGSCHILLIVFAIRLLPQP
jgi:hypothetical protein